MLTEYDFKDNEILKEIVFDEFANDGDYFISNYDNVISLKGKKWRIRKQTPDEDGYLTVSFSFDGKTTKPFYTHRLIAKHFVPNENPEEKNVVHHLDGQRQNNHYTNLVWMKKGEHDKLPRKQ